MMDKNIAKMCNHKGKSKLVGGFKWKWRDNENSDN